MNEEYLAKTEISAALSVFAERNKDRKISLSVPTFVEKLNKFIVDLPAANAETIVERTFRVPFRGLNTSWALCPECESIMMWPNKKPYKICPYCGTRRRIKPVIAAEEEKTDEQG